jgi:diguanylate cyclase (GGDEF)-like protein
MELPASLVRTLQGCRTLPSAPDVVLQVLELADDPDIGTSKVARVISRDPALTAKLLKVANSPWCGVRSEVTTLERAVNLLGINGSLSLALSFSLVRELSKTNGARFDHASYWRRSLIAAVAARAVAGYVKVAGQEELFLAGLLQDIGMLALNEALPNSYGSLVAAAEGDHEALVAIERKELGADHAQVGNWLLNKWSLPKNLSAAIAGSHDPIQVGASSQQLARSVMLGSLTAEIWLSRDTKKAAAQARAAANSLLNFQAERFEEYLGEIAASLPESARTLDIDLGGELLSSRLLDQAREALAELNVQALQEARQLEVQAQRDELTSLFNRTYLNQLLRQQFELSRQMSQPLTLIFLDIDNFKVINDSYGHHGGDSVLVSVAEAVSSAARGGDTVVRFGGDEFVVLLNNTNDEVGAMVAERIRAAVERRSHDAGEAAWTKVTVSVGCATMSPTSVFFSAKELLEAADRSLYAAKSAGRNRVVLAS